MRLKLGLMLYSSLAANSKEIVAMVFPIGASRFEKVKARKYLSIIATATLKVSTLYFFF
jgi:hypothetical protein